MKIRCLAFAALFGVCGCSSIYQPLQLDDKTGTYPTPVQVDAGDVTVFDTSSDPRAYRYVVLMADSTIRPSVFSFTVRQAMAQAGVTRVFTPEELLAVADYRKVASNGGQLTAEFLQRFAQQAGSVLVIDYRYLFVGDARFQSRLLATDAATGKVLLNVNHPQLSMVNTDAEAMYPVLNQLRKWIIESSGGRT